MALSAALRAKVAQSKLRYQNNNGKTIKPKEGRNSYRIIAPSSKDASWVDAETGQWWADVGIHWIKASADGKPIAVVGDAEFTFGEPSVLNPAIERAIAEAPDEDSRKLYESWRPRKSVLLNVIDRGNGDKLEVLELTPTTFAKVLELIEVYDEEGNDITDPETGNDIVITRTGKGLNTEYSVMASPKATKPVSPDQVKEATDLITFIRQNYFRGEEKKALAAIANTSGIALPATGGAVALNSPSASVDPELDALRKKAREEALKKQKDELKDEEVIDVDVDDVDVADVSDDDLASDLSIDEADAILDELNALAS